MAQEQNTSPHILNSSSNLLGICFIVLTSLKVLKIQADTLIDEFTTAAMILFMICCILSFLSIRNNNQRGIRLEKTADIFFLLGLFCLFSTTMLVTFDIVK